MAMNGMITMIPIILSMIPMRSDLHGRQPQELLELLTGGGADLQGCVKIAIENGHRHSGFTH